MNDSIEALYKERNAISTVELKEIEIATQTQPYEVLLYYNADGIYAYLKEDKKIPLVVNLLFYHGEQTPYPHHNTLQA